MGTPTDLKLRHTANAGPDPDGWTYYVHALGMGTQWVIESLRKRPTKNGNIETQRMFRHDCGGVFEAGRMFERDLQTWRDYIIERRNGTWR